MIHFEEKIEIKNKKRFCWFFTNGISLADFDLLLNTINTKFPSISDSLLVHVKSCSYFLDSKKSSNTYYLRYNEAGELVFGTSNFWELSKYRR